MKNKTPMSEDEFFRMWYDVSPIYLSDEMYKEVKKKAISLGYVYKSVINEAEEMYLSLVENGWRYNDNTSSQIINKQHEAIQELKKDHPKYKEG